MDSQLSKWIWILSLSAIAICSSETVYAAGSSKILVVHAYSQEYPWTKRQHEGFVSAITEGVSDIAVIKTEYLDTKRVPYTTNYAEHFKRYLINKYRDFNPDAIYVTDDNGLSFGLNYLVTMFPKTPLFFSGVNNYNIQSHLHPDLQTGVFEKKDPHPNIHLLKDLLGSVETILVVGDASNTYIVIEQELHKEFAQHDDLKPVYIAHNNIEDILVDFEQAPKAPVLLTTLGAVRDPNGEVLPLKETIARIVDISQSVVITMEDAYLFEGVLGGYVTSGDAQGKAAAELLLDYLEGKPMHSLAPVTQSPNEYIFDDRVLQSLAVELSPDLAKRSKLFHPRQGFYEEHRTLVVSILLLLTITLIATLLLYAVSVTRKKREFFKQSQQLQQQGHELEEKTVYLNSILGASTNVGFIAVDLNLVINYYNDTAAAIFGLAPDDLRGKDIYYFHEGGNSEVGNKRLDMALQVARDEGEYRFSLVQNILGNDKHMDARISPISGESGSLIGYILMAEDVTKQHEAEEVIKYQAAYDPLTNLPNRRTLMDRIGQDLSRCKRHNNLSALLFLDLDNFKQVNDTLGHTIGDALLQQVALRMNTSVRSEDTVARLGGDEFVILLPGTGENQDREKLLNNVRVTAQRLIEILAKPYQINGHELRARTSIGITVYPTREVTPDDILRHADTAMYQAKEAGRNTFRFFSPSMQEQAESRMRLMNALNQAVEQNEFDVYLQPQLNSDRELVGMESLVRWHHPDQGIVEPDEFISLAEESGLILPISNFVMRKSLDTFVKWTKQYPNVAQLRISVNVSAVQFYEDDFAEKITAILKQTGCNPTSLTLEVTETMLLGNIDGTIAKMQQLKEIGVRFSIDDFGTGYSSLSYLKRLPIDEIKIDRSFVRDVLVDSNDATLVTTILTLANQLDLEVVAEGVEVDSMLDFLNQHGCPIFQGYLFDPPLPINEFEQRYIN